MKSSNFFNLALLSASYLISSVPQTGQYGTVVHEKYAY